MIAEAIEKIESLTDSARELQVITLPGEAPDVHRVVKLGGAIEVLAKTPPHRRIEMAMLEDIVSLASKPFDSKWTRLAFFYSMSKVSLVLDHANGYELAELPIQSSVEHDWFANRIKAPVQQVRELVLACQTTIRRTRPEEDMTRFTEHVGKLSAENGSNTTAQAGRGLDAMSKSVVQKVNEPAALPNELQEFKVRPFAVPDMAWREPLLCTLLPRAADATWLFQPIEESYAEFKRFSLGRIATALARAKCPVYCGTWATIGNK